MIVKGDCNIHNSFYNSFSSDSMLFFYTQPKPNWFFIGGTPWCNIVQIWSSPYTYFLGLICMLLENLRRDHTMSSPCDHPQPLNPFFTLLAKFMGREWFLTSVNLSPYATTKIWRTDSVYFFTFLRRHWKNGIFYWP